MWSGLYAGLGAIATIGARRAASRIWRATMHEDPPTKKLAVDEQAVDRAEETARAARDAREQHEPARRRLAAADPLELLAGERPPAAVDCLCDGETGELVRVRLEVLCPQPQAE